MFKINQIIPATKLRRNFYPLIRYLDGCPQPLLITRKRGEPLVLVNGSIFEELLSFKMESEMATENVTEPNIGDRS